MISPKKLIPDPKVIDNENDHKAIDESNAFANERDLGKESKYKDHERREDLKHSFYLLMKTFVYIGAGIFLFAALVLTWHMLATDEWHWLSNKQLTDLQKNLSSAALAILVSESAKKYL